MQAAAGPWAGLAAAHSLGAPRRAHACVLCRDPAAVYCRNDDAFLCSQCDSQVHSASSAAAAHERCPAAAMAPACAPSESAAASSLPTPTAQQLRCGAVPAHGLLVRGGRHACAGTARHAAGAARGVWDSVQSCVDQLCSHSALPPLPRSPGRRHFPSLEVVAEPLQPRSVLPTAMAAAVAAAQLRAGVAAAATAQQQQQQWAAYASAAVSLVPAGAPRGDSLVSPFSLLAHRTLALPPPLPSRTAADAAARGWGGPAASVPRACNSSDELTRWEARAAAPAQASSLDAELMVGGAVMEAGWQGDGCAPAGWGCSGRARVWGCTAGRSPLNLTRRLPTHSPGSAHALAPPHPPSPQECLAGLTSDPPAEFAPLDLSHPLPLSPLEGDLALGGGERGASPRPPASHGSGSGTPDMSDGARLPRPAALWSSSQPAMLCAPHFKSRAVALQLRPAGCAARPLPPARFRGRFPHSLHPLPLPSSPPSQPP